MAISTGVYQYTSDTGVVYQVALPSDFAAALNMTVATGSEPYLPAIVSPRYATYVSNSPLSYRQAVIATLQDLSFLPASLNVNGINYLLKSFVGESIPATTFPQLAVAAGPQGPPGQNGTTITLPVSLADGGTGNDQSGSLVNPLFTEGVLFVDPTTDLVTTDAGLLYDSANTMLRARFIATLALCAQNHNNFPGPTGNIDAYSLFAPDPGSSLGLLLPQLNIFVFRGYANPSPFNGLSSPSGPPSTFGQILLDTTGLANTLTSGALNVPIASSATNGFVLTAGI